MTCAEWLRKPLQSRSYKAVDHACLEQYLTRTIHSRVPTCQKTWELSMIIEQ